MPQGGSRMKKRIFALLLVLSLSLCAGSLIAINNQPAAPEPTISPTGTPAPTATPEPTPEPTLSPEEQAALALQEAEEAATQQRQAILESMSLEEKVGQLFFVRCPETGAAEDVAAYHLGGILLFGRDFTDEQDNWLSLEQVQANIQSYQDAAAIPLFIGSDEEGGTVTRASRNPNLFSQKLPSPQSLYAEGGMDLLLNTTLEYNTTLRATLGINVNFAPVADVSTDPDDFIYDRSFGQDATATADYTAAMVQTMAEAGVASVLKHFPGYGNNVDTHTGIAVDTRSYESFETGDFLPFLAGIEAGAPFVLVSHNIVTCMDEEFPASLSPTVHRILREDLGFEGVILTDDLAMEAVSAYARDGSAAVQAILAGNDMIVTTDYKTQIPQVLEAVENGILSVDEINEHVLRILRAKQDLGLLD